MSLSLLPPAALVGLITFGKVVCYRQMDILYCHKLFFNLKSFN